MTRAWTLLAACTLTFALSDRVHAAPPAKPKAKATTKAKPTHGKNRPGAKTKKNNNKKKKGKLEKKSVKATGPGGSMKNGMTLIRPAGTKVPDPPSAPAELKSDQATQGKVKAAAAPADQLIALKKVELTPRRPAVGRVYLDAYNAFWSAALNQMWVENEGPGGTQGSVEIRASTRASGLVLQVRCEGKFGGEMTVYGRHRGEDYSYSTTHHAEFSHVDDVLNFTMEFGDDQAGPYKVVLGSPKFGNFMLRSCEVEWR